MSEKRLETFGLKFRKRAYLRRQVGARQCLGFSKCISTFGAKNGLIMAQRGQNLEHSRGCFYGHVF